MNYLMTTGFISSGISFLSSEDIISKLLFSISFGVCIQVPYYQPLLFCINFIHINIFPDIFGKNIKLLMFLVVPVRITAHLFNSFFSVKIFYYILCVFVKNPMNITACNIIPVCTSAVGQEIFIACPSDPYVFHNR